MQAGAFIDAQYLFSRLQCVSVSPESRRFVSHASTSFLSRNHRNVEKYTDCFGTHYIKLVILNREWRVSFFGFEHFNLHFLLTCKHNINILQTHLTFS